MRVLVVGGGGREHAIIRRLKESRNVTQLFALPGNAGISRDAAAAIAWLLRHPAGIQPIIGTMNTAHLRYLAAAADVTLSREEWYTIYQAAGNQLP